MVRQRPTIQRLSRSRLSQVERGQGRGAFLTDASTTGFTPRVTVKIRTEPADDHTAALLELRPGDPVLVRDRMMYADETPVQLATSRLPKQLTEGSAIEQEDTGSGGIYARLEEAGHKLERFTETVQARPPEPAETTALRLRAGQHVLALTRVAYTASETPVEVNAMVLAAERYQLVYEFPAYCTRSPR